VPPAAPEPTPPSPQRASARLSGRALAALGVASGAVFLLAFVAIAANTPFRLGFDDAEHLRAALLWRQHFTLDATGPFLRVPLWQILLGSVFLVFEPTRGVAIFQCSMVLAAVAVFLLHVRAVSRWRGLPWLAVALPLALFVGSPQTLLYARHAVNELWIGLLAMLVLHLGVVRPRGAAALSGLACGAAAMTKLVMLVLAAPALAFLLRGESRERQLRRTAAFLLGAGVVGLPLLALHVHQRGLVPLDTTSAYTLSEYMPPEWMALGDPVERYRAGLENFREIVARDPIGYLQDALRRLGRWIVRPATADFALYDPRFPSVAVGAWEHAVLWTLLGLAALGTTAASAPIWILLAAIPLLCAFPLHVPFTPKIVPVFPCLLLAPLGVQKLRALTSRGV
jgi:hypothetical protein